MPKTKNLISKTEYICDSQDRRNPALGFLSYYSSITSIRVQIEIRFILKATSLSNFQIGDVKSRNWTQKVRGCILYESCRAGRDEMSRERGKQLTCHGDDKPFKETPFGRNDTR